MSKKKRKSRKKKRGPSRPKPKIIKIHPDGGSIIQPSRTSAEIQAASIQAIPRIIGADFEEGEHRQLAAYEEKLRKVKPRDGKLRILLNCEATYLHTGFSHYGYEILTRLHATGKYDIFELSSYGEYGDPRAKQLPWKNYPVMPKNQIEMQEFKSDKANQFGKWKLTQALIDCKPDVVIDLRDWWMLEHVFRNPLRKNFHFIAMPTVDGFPQKWQWLKDYQEADTLLTYSHFGKKVLEEQSKWPLSKAKGINKLLQVTDVCQPGVDLDIYKPLEKYQAHEKFGIPREMRFCGTVMRNQPRKLFPRIIEGFCQFKKRYPQEAENVFLLLHTSIPDVGWNRGAGILETIERQGLGAFVYFSYICNTCGHMSISRWIGSPTVCPKCRVGPNPDGSGGFRTPNTQVGYSEENLNIVLNLLDVYIQGSVAEGCGMPLNQAKACGVPVLASNYSAMYEKARNGGGMWIENDSLYNEGSEGCHKCGYLQEGTMQYRSHFSRKDIAKKLALLFGDEQLRSKLAKEARECAEKYYNWDLTAKKWELVLDTIKVKDRKETWDKPIDSMKLPTKESPPENLSDEEWLLWIYQNILKRTEKDANGKVIMLEDGTPMPVQKVDNSGRKTWISHLKAGTPRSELEKYFRSLMKHDEEIFEIMSQPELAFKNPIERIAMEVEEAEKER